MVSLLKSLVGSGYLLRRLGQAALTLVLVSFLIFGLVRSIPGSPIDGDPALQNPDKMISAEARAKIEKEWGLDKPWYEAYFTHYVSNIVQGDLGRSFATKQPVARMIGERIGPTMILSVSSLLLTYLLAIPLGLLSSARAGKPDERTISVVLYMLYSLPGFVAALYLQLYLAVKLGWLPLSGYSQLDGDQVSTGEYAWDVFLHALMPVVVYTYGSLAYYSRFVRANMQETLRQDYIRTARAKGLSEWTVVVKHAFRNTLIPLVTLIGLTLPSLLSGSVIIEQIFDWPGIGQLFFQSITKRDYNVIMGLTLMFAVLTLAGQLLADILYAVVDPRVRLG